MGDVPHYCQCNPCTNVPHYIIASAIPARTSPITIINFFQFQILCNAILQPRPSFQDFNIPR